MPNPNHPKKGQSTRVEPIRRLEDVESIKKLLSDNPRDFLLFTMGVNNGFRVGDLLRLRVKQVRHLKPGDEITVKESKTGKLNTLMINKTTHKVLKKYLEETQPEDDDYLFYSRRTKQALTIGTVNAMVKRWCRAINLQGNYGAHTLRKTFGYIQRTKYGVGFEVLADRFNHASPATTMAYLGITRKEVSTVLMNEI